MSLFDTLLTDEAKVTYLNDDYSFDSGEKYIEYKIILSYNNSRYAFFFHQEEGEVHCTVTSDDVSTTYLLTNKWEDKYFKKLLTKARKDLGKYLN